MLGLSRNLPGEIIQGIEAQIQTFLFIATKFAREAAG
jgi:hypothetical protein